MSKRERLLEASYMELAEKGFSSVTLDAIALRAGVSKGIIIYYFSSKELLLEKLFEWLTKRLLSRLQEAEGTPVARLEQLIDVLFESSQANRAFYSVYFDFAVQSTHSPSLRRIRKDFYSQISSLIRQIVVSGVEQSYFPAQDIDRAVVLIHVLVEGLMLRWLAEELLDLYFPFYKESCLSEVLHIVGYQKKI